MAVETQIQRLQTARNDIRNKLVELALVEDTARLDDLALAVQNIKNNGDVDAEVKEGETFTIPAGYHNGSGTVKGVAGGGNYILQAKTVTPTKEQQSVTPDQGKYGLSSVTVNAIPSAYQNVTDVTATAADVLTGKVIVDATGRVVAGSMTNNGEVNDVLHIGNPGFTIPKGYHSGGGSITIHPESKTVTPTESQQIIAASAGKVLDTVTIEPIPDNYENTDGVNTTADKILSGQEVITSAGRITGTMANNSKIDQFIIWDDTSGEATSVTIPQGYHPAGGKVYVNWEEKEATPSKSQQTVVASRKADTVLSKVIINPIPDKYQDVTDVTATASAVLEGHDFVDSTGAVVEGTMINRGKVTQTIDGLATPSYTIPQGYHDGTGTVSLTSDIEMMLMAI